MAAVVGAVEEVFGFATVSGPAKSSDSRNIESCFVSITFSGTYASANDATCVALGAAIASAKKNGKTVRLLSAAWAGPGYEDGLAIGADTVTVTTTLLTCQLTKADFTTEHDAAAMGTWAGGVKFFCTYSEA